jgi:hypothetical protein
MIEMKPRLDPLSNVLNAVQDAMTGVCVLGTDCISSKQTTKEMFRQLSDNACKVTKACGSCSKEFNLPHLTCCDNKCRRAFQFAIIILLICHDSTRLFDSDYNTTDNLYALYQSLVRAPDHQ